jgi:hypothetical protein
MGWLTRSVTPWTAVALHASGGACLAGLGTAIWLLVRQRADPVPCFLDMCETEIALAAVFLAGTYFVASTAVAASVAVLQLGGAPVRLRSLVALAGPPAVWPIALVVLG